MSAHRRKPRRVPPNRRVDLPPPPRAGGFEMLSQGDGIVFLETTIEGEPRTLDFDGNGSECSCLVVDDARCQEFFRRHGAEAGVEITSSWAAVFGSEAVYAILTLRLAADGATLRLRFPMPDGYVFLRGWAETHTFALVCVRSAQMLGGRLASDSKPLEAAYAAALLFQAITAARAAVVPSGENAGRTLADIVAQANGRAWLRWAGRRPPGHWPPDFREAVEALLAAVRFAEAA